MPESFNVLIRELQSLCLDVELIKPERRSRWSAPQSQRQTRQSGVRDGLETDAIGHAAWQRILLRCGI